MGLRTSYRWIAPFYDLLLHAPLEAARRRSLRDLPPGRLLLAGVGTGLDLPLLEPQREAVGLDLTPAMLRRARARAPDVPLVEGDCMRLPFADASFDHVLLHLILAVVPQPQACLREAARVLRPGGELRILDKFLRQGQAAPLRRLLSPLAGRVATRTDVVFETVLAGVPGLALLEDAPALLGGWFRRIRLRRLSAGR